MRVRTSYSCVCTIAIACFAQISLTLQETFLIGIKSSRALTTFIKRIKTGLETFYSQSTNCRPTLYLIIVSILYHFHKILLDVAIFVQFNNYVSITIIIKISLIQKSYY